MPIDRISLFCFQASYAVALLLELVQLVRPRRILALAALGFGVAGLVAHTLFLIAQGPPPLATQFGSALFLAWILAVFYVYGSLHHRRIVWGVFVLPLVFGLTTLAQVFEKAPAEREGSWLEQLFSVENENPRIWLILHITFDLLAAVGVCIAFLASVMYLIQARRLKVKAGMGRRLPMLSLERLEAMNRRALNLTFPLLTGGVLIGLALMWQSVQSRIIVSWTDPRIVSSLSLWLVFALLIYLRYGVHVRGKRLAWLTLCAFPLMVVALATAHPAAGGAP